ncbi:MAG: hypothetical protein G01um101413_102 [Parcubacteria group bacterium Gr01-1014_13]|nr:MAG: hypothetical protein G01um101413_102 [Parcubacteria group bacterium Gr01-1014_13]
MYSWSTKRKIAIEMGVLFLLYTALGISVEAIFTGIGDIIRNELAGNSFDPILPCRVSLWIIPVYGLSATIAFAIIDAYLPRLFSWPWWIRGLIYMVVIYSFEFVWALALESLLGIQVWNYEDSEYRIWRYINPYFCVVWFVFGFALEKVKVYILPRLLKS